MTQALAQVLKPQDQIVVIFKEALTFRKADDHFNIQGTSYQTINQGNIITGHLIAIDGDHVYFECKQGDVVAAIKAPLSYVIVRKINRVVVKAPPSTQCSNSEALCGTE